MSKPTSNEIRGILEGYNITSDYVSDSWIETRRDNYVIPFIEKITRIPFSGVVTKQEYVSGNGTNILFVGRRDIKSLIAIKYVLGGDNQRVLNLANVELLADEGIIKAKRNAVETWIMPVFPKGEKNLLIIFTVGYADTDMPIEIKEAISLFTADMVLMQIEGRFGGGDVSAEGFSKGYGNRGKYTNIRNDLIRLAHFNLNRYRTSVV